jgi:hypothetical protein
MSCTIILDVEQKGRYPDDITLMAFDATSTSDRIAGCACPFPSTVTSMYESGSDSDSARKFHLRLRF